MAKRSLLSRCPSYIKLAYEIQQEGHAEELAVEPAVLSAVEGVSKTMHVSETFKHDRRDLQRLPECGSVCNI